MVSWPVLSTPAGSPLVAPRTGVEAVARLVLLREAADPVVPVPAACHRPTRLTIAVSSAATPVRIPGKVLQNAQKRPFLLPAGWVSGVGCELDILTILPVGRSFATACAAT